MCTNLHGLLCTLPGKEEEANMVESNKEVHKCSNTSAVSLQALDYFNI